MKNANNIGKRLFSLALALIMVLSYVPAEVFAEEPAAGLWSASVVTEVEEIVPETTEATESSETEDPEATGAVAVDAPAPVYKYHHTVSVIGIDGNPVADAKVEGIGENAENEKSVTVTVTYKGMTLTVSSGETAHWNASATWGSITAGAALPAHSHTDSGLAAEDGAKWTTVYKEVKKTEGGEVEEEIALKDGDIVGSVWIGRTLKAVSTLTYAGETLKTLTNENTVGYAVATYSCSHATGWYAEMPTVTLTAETAVTDSACLAPVTVNEVAFSANWILAAEGDKFTCEIPAAESEMTKTIKVGGVDVELNVDNVQPEISSLSAIRRDDGTRVKFNYTVGNSGAAFTINGKELAVDEKDSYDGVLTDIGNEVTIKLTNGAGVVSSATVSVQPLPTIAISGLVNNTEYVNKDGKVTLTASQLAAPVEMVKWIISRDGVEETIEGKTQIDLTISSAVTVLNVTLKDGDTRTAEKDLSNLRVDDVKPEVGLTVFKGEEEIDPPAAGTVLPYEVTYKLTMTDNVAIGGGKATFYVNAKEQDPIDFIDGVASYTVKNGEYLTSITYSAHDAAGNTVENTTKIEPKVKVDTVKPIVEVVGFSISAAPNQVETGSKYLGFKSGIGDITAELKVKLIDENPDTTSLKNAGWVEETDSKGKVTWYKTISAKVQAGSNAKLDVAALNVVDLAGNKPVADMTVKVTAKNGKTYEIKFSPKNGEFEGGILINNGDPTCEKPSNLLELTLDPAGMTGVVDADGLPVYKEDFTINVSGASGVTIDNWDEGNGTAVLSEGGIKVTPAQGLEKEVTLYASTSTTADEIAFTVDTLAPRVTVNLISDDKEVQHYDDDADYYQKPVTLKFTVADMLGVTGKITYQIEGKEPTSIDVVNGSTDYSFTVEPNQKLVSLTVDVQDAMGNQAKSFTDYEFYDIVVDDVAPVPSVVVHETEGNADAKPVQTDAGVEYYDKQVTIVASVDEEYGDSATLSYTINGVNESKTFKPTGNSWSFPLLLNDGDKVTGISLTATDKAGNECEPKTISDIVFDETDPVIDPIVETIEDDKDYIQTFAGKKYYNGTVAYTITFVEKYLDIDNTKITATFAGETEARKIPFNGVEGEPDTYTATIPVGAGETLKGYSVTVVDYAKRSDTEVYGGEETEEYPIVVDKLSPKAEMTLSGDIAELVEKNGVYYVRMNTQVEGKENGTFEPEESDKEAEVKYDPSVTLTITVDDANIALWQEGLKDNTYVSTVEDKDGKWTMVEGNPTFTVTRNVPIHTSEEIDFAIGVFDLAGNKMDLTVKGLDNPEEGYVLPFESTDGTLAAHLVLDRRTPSTNEDDGEGEVEVPAINLTDDAKPNVNKYLYNDKDHYTAPFNFNLKVLDQHSGLKEVKYKLVDGGGVINGKVLTKDKDYEEAEDIVTEDPIPIAVERDIAGETDDAKITITATDNVDNKITYVKHFAYDDLGPRVSVSYGGKSKRENGYYNETRTITVYVEDLHFIGENIVIKEGPAHTAQESNGFTWDLVAGEPNKYQHTFTYSNDGDYIFEITGVTDIFGNPGDIPTIADSEFTIDKTAPEINVSYAPGTHSGKDAQGVLYYDEKVTATVLITEHNFAKEDVKTDGITLSFGNGKGDEHSASSTFDENNNYKFTVTYTDLAGNPAKPYSSPTFSVDLTAPTVEMTRGNLNLDELNIIQEDLELAFTVNDAQHNLSDYEVTVYHLNNAFQRTAVSGAEYYTVTTQENRTTVLVNFATIEALKENDGIYTVEITAVDYAGNTVRLTPDLTISLNRFGSTFTTNDKFTTEFLTTGSDGNAYHSTIDNKLVIQEINPNRVWQDSSKKTEGSVLTVVVNGTATQLTAGKEYNMTVTQEGSGDNKWFVYTYEIDPSTFKDGGAIVDGRYTVLIYGEDDAGNKNTNESNEYGAIQLNAEGDHSGKIEFVLDATAPIITTTGIESGKTYNAEFQRLDIYLSDNTPADIAVYLNDALIPVAESAAGLANTEAWLVYNADIGAYTLNVPEQNTLFNGQSIKIVATDAAGNEAEYSIEDFNVSTNLFVRLLNNAWFIGGTATTLVLALILLILKKKKIAAQVA